MELAENGSARAHERQYLPLRRLSNIVAAILEAAGKA
jgi:hypothetical protein